jgi:hypothetical protein
VIRPVRFGAVEHAHADRGWIGLTCPSIVDTGQVRIHAALLAAYPDPRSQDAWRVTNVGTEVAFATNDFAAGSSSSRL